MYTAEVGSKGLTIDFLGSVVYGDATVTDQVVTELGTNQTYLVTDQAVPPPAHRFYNDPKPRPCYSPVYAAALYPELAELFREHGYALAAHGSLRRDFDLLAVPWVEEPKSSPEEIVKLITTHWHIREIGVPENKPHGRRAWTLSVGHGECSIDLCFMPVTPGYWQRPAIRNYPLDRP